MGEPGRRGRAWLSGASVGARARRHLAARRQSRHAQVLIYSDEHTAHLAGQICPPPSTLMLSASQKLWLAIGRRSATGLTRERHVLTFVPRMLPCARALNGCRWILRDAGSLATSDMLLLTPLPAELHRCGSNSVVACARARGCLCALPSTVLQAAQELATAEKSSRRRKDVAPVAYRGVIEQPHAVDDRAPPSTTLRDAFVHPSVHASTVRTVGRRQQLREAEMLRVARDLPKPAAPPASWETTYGAEIASGAPEPKALRDLAAERGITQARSLQHEPAISFWAERIDRVGSASTGHSAFGRNTFFSQPIDEYKRDYTKVEEESNAAAVETNRRAFAAQAGPVFL